MPSFGSNNGHNQPYGTSAPWAVQTGIHEIKQLGQLQGKSAAEIQQLLLNAGYLPVQAHSGGTVWTKPGNDGTTAAVRVDPPTIRPMPQGYADEVPHVHKELVPTNKVKNGNYKPPSATTLDDNGNPTTDPRQTHIPGGH